MGDDGVNSPGHLIDAADDTSQELTPKANFKDAAVLKVKPVVSTPKRGTADSTPSSAISLPTLDEVWNTATTSRNLRSPSKNGPESSLLKFKSEFSGGVNSGLSTPKKNLFPNSTQPANGSSAFSPVNEKATLSNTKTRRTSAFSIPKGTEVVSLSSDDDDMPPPVETYADDDKDEDYQVKKAPRGKAKAPFKSGRQAAARGRGKAKDGSRAVSMPASAKVVRTAPVAASAVYHKGKKGGVGRRAASMAFDGEI